MAKKPTGNGKGSTPAGELLATVSCGTDKLLLAALERGGNCLETGRFLISYREGRVEEGIKSLKAQKFRIADARDFTDQAVSLEDAGDAEAMVFPEIGVALVGGDALQQHGMSALGKVAADSPIEITSHRLAMAQFRPARTPAPVLLPELVSTLPTKTCASYAIP